MRKRKNSQQTNSRMQWYKNWIIERCKRGNWVSVWNQQTRNRSIGITHIRSGSHFERWFLRAWRGIVFSPISAMWFNAEPARNHEIWFSLREWLTSISNSWPLCLCTWWKEWETKTAIRAGKRNHTFIVMNHEVAYTNCQGSAWGEVLQPKNGNFVTATNSIIIIGIVKCEGQESLFFQIRFMNASKRFCYDCSTSEMSWFKSCTSSKCRNRTTNERWEQTEKEKAMHSPACSREDPRISERET